MQQMSLMDVMRPEILNIGGRRYRKLFVQKNKPEDEQQHGTYYEEDMYYDDEPESCQAEYCNIEKTNSGYKEILKDIPSFYLRFIFVARKELESKSKTSIQLPTKGSTGGDVIINGKDRNGIIVARTKINTIIEMNRGEQPAGHFVCIKLALDDITKNFEEFKKNVLLMKLRGMEESLFQSPERLHLTLCLMTFVNNIEIEESKDDLNMITRELCEKHLQGGSLKLRLQGIEYMNDDPGEVDVLYAKVNVLDYANDFQMFADELVSALISNGYSKKQFERVKLHATIINSLFRDTGPSERGARKERVAFDAKPILETYGDFHFGDIELPSVDVALRKTFDKNGHYKLALSIPLSNN